MDEEQTSENNKECMLFEYMTKDIKLQLIWYQRLLP